MLHIENPYDLNFFLVQSKFKELKSKIMNTFKEKYEIPLNYSDRSVFSKICFVEAKEIENSKELEQADDVAFYKTNLGSGFVNRLVQFKTRVADLLKMMNSAINSKSRYHIDVCGTPSSGKTTAATITIPYLLGKGFIDNGAADVWHYKLTLEPKTDILNIFIHLFHHINPSYFPNNYTNMQTGNIVTILGMRMRDFCIYLKNMNTKLLITLDEVQVLTVEQLNLIRSFVKSPDFAGITFILAGSTSALYLKKLDSTITNGTSYLQRQFIFEIERSSTQNQIIDTINILSNKDICHHLSYLLSVFGALNVSTLSLVDVYVETAKDFVTGVQQAINSILNTYKNDLLAFMAEKESYKYNLLAASMDIKYLNLNDQIFITDFSIEEKRDENLAFADLNFHKVVHSLVYVDTENKVQVYENEGFIGLHFLLDIPLTLFAQLYKKHKDWTPEGMENLTEEVCFQLKKCFDSINGRPGDFLKPNTKELLRYARNNISHPKVKYQILDLLVVHVFKRDLERIIKFKNSVCAKSDETSF